MPKKQITEEEKIKVIEQYIHNEIGFGEIGKRYGIPKSTLRHWIDRYRTFGAEGLLPINRQDQPGKKLGKTVIQVAFFTPVC